MVAFLRPPLGEAVERSSSFKACCRKRHRSNVSEVFFQSNDAHERSSEEGSEGISIREEKRGRRLENPPHSSSENDAAL